MFALDRQSHPIQRPRTGARSGACDVGSRWRRCLPRFVFLGLVALSLGACSSGSVAVDGPFVLATTIDGPITPVIAGHIRDGIDQAERNGAVAYLIRLDTPGGLDSSMRDIIQEIYAASVPVIVYVAPAGARGTSAGAIITFAAHVAAMAPGTAIGAATPVGGGGGEDLDTKVINDAAAFAESIAELRGRNAEFIVETVTEGRSASATEALDLGAIDLIAATTTELLEAVDGLVLEVGQPSADYQLETAGIAVVEQEMGFFRSVQQVLADPNIAFLLLSIGTLGLIYELASPGLGVGAVLGLTFIVLGLFGLAVLSVNLVGVVFLLLAAALFVAEVFAPGIGIAAAGGAFALVLSAIFLFDDAPGLEVSLAVILPAIAVITLFVVAAGRFAMRARRAPSTTTGADLVVGHEAEVRAPAGVAQVFAAGAWWGIRSQRAGQSVVVGDRVRIVGIDGLTLLIEPVENEPIEHESTASLSSQTSVLKEEEQP
jgi:membrane-bound serine protease (ClpP class)